MSHIRKIADALWSENVGCRAAVMLGTGFSANAEKVSSNTPDMPMWSVLRKKMLNELEIEDYGQDALTVADLYESSFGKTSLEAFLMNCIPDREFVPGELHERLLKLPWSDIFTTNYDTLLERGAEKVIERRYSYVYSAEDIPLARPPRIIKLHGTFQRNRPLVFSREDYRKYPVQNAPFVNFVQESIMENVFCLLGFSGTDPNFLQWIGWVRDNLKEYQPIIYLCGLLDITNHERKRLEKLNIQPIDLTPMFPANEYPNRRSRYKKALIWFLDELRKGAPYNPDAWPRYINTENENNNNQLDASDKEFENINSINDSLVELARTLPFANNISEQLIENICNKFSSIRKSYPGWLIAPYRMRNDLYSSLQLWRGIAIKINNIDNISPIIKLRFLYEVYWRASCALFFIDGPFAEVIINTMEQVNPFHKYITLPNDCITPENMPSNLKNKFNWDEIGEWWVTLALSIMRVARVMQDNNLFDTWSDGLKEVVKHDIEWSMQWHYEKCLNALFNLNVDMLFGELEEWDETKGNAFWRIRKASLLAEIGSLTHAKNLVEQGIKQIRESIACRTTIDYTLLSEEGVALNLALLLNYPSLSSIELQDRFKELRKYKCDFSVELDEIRHRINDYQPHRTVSKKIGYDPMTVQISRKYNSNSQNMLDAVNLFYVFEVIGLPIRIYGNVILPEISKASSWIYPIMPRPALVMLARKGNLEEIENYFSRFSVAQMPDESVNSTFDWLFGSMVCSYQHLCSFKNKGYNNGFLLNIINVAMAVISYLSFRLSNDRKLKLYQFLIEFYDDERNYRYRILKNTVSNLWMRLIMCSDKSIIEQYIIQFLKSPVDNKNEWNPFVYVLEYHSKDIEINRQNDTELEILVKDLIENVRRFRGSQRSQSVLKLVWLQQNNILTEEEKADFGNALWFNSDKNPNKLPNDTGLYAFQLLILPGNEECITKHYKMFLESTDFGFFNIKSSDSIENTQPVLYSNDCLNAIRALKSDEDNGIRKFISWTKTDAVWMLNKIHDFWEKNKEFFDDSKITEDIFFSKTFCIERIHTVMFHISKVFGRMVMPYISQMETNEQDMTKEFYSEIKSYDWHLAILPFELYLDNTAGERILNALQDSIYAKNKTRVKDALEGIYEWFNFVAPNDVLDIRQSQNLSPLIEKLLEYLCWRKRKCFFSVIQYVSLLVRYNKEDVLPYKEKLFKALGYMYDDISETDTLIDEEDDAVDNIDKYLFHYQAYASELAYYVYKCFFDDNDEEIPDILKKWKEFCRKSCLPEVNKWFTDV